MVRIKFFASLRESLGTSEEIIEINNIKTVGDIKKNLVSRGGIWKKVFEENRVIKIAANKKLVNENFEIKDGDEVAFFPPVTGG
tara:strand:- start:346 stop:597 length:252 start_codon:yes stop_codon:yes gene_type:complete